MERLVFMAIGISLEFLRSLFLGHQANKKNRANEAQVFAARALPLLEEVSEHQIRYRAAHQAGLEEVRQYFRSTFQLVSKADARELESAANKVRLQGVDAIELCRKSAAALSQLTRKHDAVRSDLDLEGSGTVADERNAYLDCIEGAVNALAGSLSRIRKLIGTTAVGRLDALKSRGQV